MDYYFPKASHYKQQTRRVGFEVEFAGLEMQQVIDIVAKSLGGEVETLSQAESLVHSDLGKFTIELDWGFAKSKAKEIAEAKHKNETDEKLMGYLTKAAATLVPTEIVCPPIAINQLYKLDAMITALREAGAKGTDENWLYAFGVHINPELPDTSAPALVAYLQAFAVCQQWLLKAHNVDLARRITPYIDLYKKEYCLLLLGYQGDESVEQIMRDYLNHNPSRNRALDMLPMFRFLDEAFIKQQLPHEKINARPTLHYRLANCEIEKSSWQLSQSWNVFSVVDYLANSPKELAAIKQQYIKYQQQLISLTEEPWHKTLSNIHAQLLA